LTAGEEKEFLSRLSENESGQLKQSCTRFNPIRTPGF